MGHPADLGAKAWDYIGVGLHRRGTTSAWDYIGVGLLGAAAVLPAVTSISSWAYIVAGTFATLLAAHLSYGYLERPLMNRVTARQELRLARRPRRPGPRCAGAVA